MSDEPRCTAPAHIEEQHDLTAFDCGQPELNEWLRRQALKNESSGASRTYVTCVEGRVVGWVAKQAGIRAVLLHAMTADAKRFYQRAGFQESPVDPMTMMIAIADAEQAVATA